MNRSAIVLLVAALALGAGRAAAQTGQPDPAAPQTAPDATTKPDNATPDSATSGVGHGNHAVRASEDRTSHDGNGPPPNPPAKDETVGVGGSVDVAPRDIREPFDE